MMPDPPPGGPQPGGVLARLVHRYLELSDLCYRVSVLGHDGRGRFPKGHRVRQPHPALVKKMDLDEALITLYRRFFDPDYRVSPTSTSNSRRQGSDACTSPGASSPGPASRSK